jgi:hypothetical protein
MGSGGGETSTTTVDPVYNAGMLKLSQEQQGWGREMFNMFKYGVTYDPNEKVQVDSEGNIVEQPAGGGGGGGGGLDAGGGQSYGYRNVLDGSWRENPPGRDDQGWVPDTGGGTRAARSAGGGAPRPAAGGATGLDVRTVTRGELEGYNADETTSEMEYLQNVVEANQSLLGLQTGAQKKRLNLYNTYVDDVNEGIDVNARMDQAQAGVQHGFKNANRAARMDIASYGLDPGSGRYAGLNRETAMAEATGVAGARTAAKNYAETEDFARKTTGLQVQ